LADDIDDDNDLDQPVAAADKPAPATVLIEEVITAAIPAHVRRRMTQKGKGYALLLVVPDADWGRACAHLLSGAKGGGVQCRTFLEVPKNKSHQQDPAMIRALSKGQRLVLISPNPAAMIPDVVRRAADDVVTIGTPPVEVMRKAIRRITGRIVRGLQLADYTELDFDLLVSCLRPEDRPADIIRRLRELSATPPALDVQVPAGPLLTQLPLTNTVRAWSDQMLEELAAVKRGTLDPAVLIYGALEGPPGTGKSLIARSLAATAGWNFVSSSVGAWFTSGDGALGGVARNVKAFVDTILATEPCIGFLDELDAIPDRETMDNRGRDWWTPVITLILTEVDRLRASGRKVLLLGASNYYHRLDAALIRPGRMQQRISVLPPSTAEEVLAVLRHYLGDDLSQEQARLAGVAIGATPAAIEGWVKSARAVARMAGRALTASDLLDQIAPADGRSAADLRTTALHELGHAIVAAELGHTVERISILAGIGTGGATSTRLVSVVPTIAHLHNLVTIALGGRAADIVLGTGANAGAETDLAQATELLLAARLRQGLGDTLAAMPAVAAPALMKEVDADLKRLLARAMAIIQKYRADMLRLADQLLDERIMTGDAVLGAVRSRKTRKPPRPSIMEAGECGSGAGPAP
jgi:cell division protease FtsH